MNGITRLDQRQVSHLCTTLEQHVGALPAAGLRSLGLRGCVKTTLLYLAHNLTQELIAAIMDVSQATISRVIGAYTPLIAQALQDAVPTVEDLEPTTELIIDGTLAPCWSWRDHPELYSGKHHTTGVNLQVACTLSGHLAWVSDPLPGRAHDVTALRASGLLDLPTSDLPTGTKPPRHLGDKGYTGTTMITPYRKPPHRPLTSTEKDANHAHGRIRYKIERTIANIKTWRILHNDYRRPLNTFNTTITAVLALIFTYNTP